MVHEYHHRHKADSPSGTAQMIGELLIAGLDRKRNIVTDSLNRQIEESEIHISSTRGGSIPGIHRVSFDSEVDTIILEHSARDRGGFADGALLAAEWIYGRSGLFSIDDLMQSVIRGEKI
jgi:4-hydroxy-tetrahydrodipicolinate reductase